MVEITDSGPVFPPPEQHNCNGYQVGGLGLVGLAVRAEIQTFGFIARSGPPAYQPPTWQQRLAAALMQGAPQ